MTSLSLSEGSLLCLFPPSTEMLPQCQGLGARLKVPGLPGVSSAAYIALGRAELSIASDWTRATDVQDLVPVRNGAETPVGLCNVGVGGSWVSVASLFKQ